MTVSRSFSFSSRVFGTLAVVLALSSLSHPALAQTEGELKAARELFQEAFKDEEAKRYPEALEKFQRVAKVKESPAVRYRIATVLMAMGRLREARDMYRALAATKSSSQPQSDQDIADASEKKAAELDKRIPKLAIRVQDNPPEDMKVSVDGNGVPASTTPTTVELDPGDHVVTASGKGMAPSEQKVTLADGAGEVQHTVTLAPATGDKPPDTTTPKSSNTLAWVAIGGGGALVLIGGSLLIAREGAINDIKTTCPNRHCPESKRNDVENDISNAETFGPLGGALVVVGLVAVGVGVYLLVRSPRAAAPPVEPTQGKDGKQGRGKMPATTTPAPDLVVLPGWGGMRLQLTF